MNRLSSTIASLVALAAACAALLVISSNRVDGSTKAAVASVGVFSVVVAVLIIGGTR